ncbi:hypothetical protein C9B59_02875 [Salmonella enterica]|nr:hypothetical protein [Salmonella enterica]
MPGVLLWFFKGVIALLLAFAVGLIVYYYLEIRPIAQTALQSASFWLSESPQTRFLRRAAAKIHPKSYTARLLYTQAGVDGHFRTAIWVFWLDSLYRDDELYAMMLAQAYYGRDSQGNAVYGTKNAALTLFHVPVTEMACQQQVQLIYMFKAPSLYQPGSARLVESSKHYMTLCQEQIQE